LVHPIKRVQRVLVRKLKEINHFEDRGIDETIILK
jgi:hypothetical protein